jgi:carbamoyl-phosphate synthase small subunit
MTISFDTIEKPDNANALLMLSNGAVFWGRGMGAQGVRVGEVCFNTAMTGYQETLTDPSYAGQIINFTFPHIGNVGANLEDLENAKPRCMGAIFAEDITQPSNWRAVMPFHEWLLLNDLPAIAGLDTRALTQYIRDNGAPNAILVHDADGQFDLPALYAQLQEFSGLNGLDLAIKVTCDKPYEWASGQKGAKHIVAVDYGAKHNILRCLAGQGARVTVVPAQTSATDILALNPDGVFLSNGPGDPAATGVYAVPVIQDLMKQDKLPIFGICLGHQLLALALGGRTEKMHLGHRGANHPVQDIQTSKVEITSQNHGFHVIPDSLPNHVEVTHISLFDKTNEGIKVKDRPIFSVQYHPEASPGPHDSHYLFNRFFDMMAA